MNDDIDEHYRRIFDRDTSRPSESVRRAIFSYAAQLAAERAAEPIDTHITRAATAHRGWRRRAIFGTLAAAVLAGLWVTPHFLPVDAPNSGATTPKQNPSASAQSAVQEVTVTARHRTRPDEAASVDAGQAALHPAPRSAPAAKLAESTHDEIAAARGPRPTASSAGAASRNSAMAVPMPAAPSAAPAAPAVRPANSPASLPQAAASGDLLGVRAQLGQGADVEARDANGRTALMLAILKGHAPLVEELLAHGADPNAADSDGVTPLQAAAAGHQPSIVAALRRAGAR